MRSIVIHGHFYQPPRENPWLEDVEREASAAPHHDWNARIEQECYRAVVAARVLAPDGRISRIVNTLEYISFNFGPTLLEWMEHAAPDTYARILDADRRSIARLGHGNAIAQPYHHAILPLSSRRDKLTEVRWGIADFRRRFGREPEGMWLPETALDDETLDVLAQEGIRFTVVAPGQVTSVPNDGRPGRYATSNGRSIALCIYDGDISHGIAFGGLLGDAHTWAKRMLARTERRHTPRDGAQVEAGHWEPDPATDGGTRPLTTGEMLAISATGAPVARGQRYRLVSAATDGETYGHHHRFAEMALARVVLDLDATRGVKVENYASFLAHHPATDDVEIVAPSAWSCAHGVERWRSNCGCRMRDGTNQEWRTPLRSAISELAEGIHAVYERESARYFDQPWAVRDAYGGVVATPDRIEPWVASRVRADVPNDVQPAGDRVPSAMALLEMERGALRIFTSCAWFFDDISGLEPLEVLRYAARAIELAGPDGVALEQAFLERLREARSSDPGVGTGADVYTGVAKPSLGQFARLAGSVAAARAVAEMDPCALETSVALRVHADNGTVTVQQFRTGQRDSFAVSVSGVSNGTPPSVIHRPLGITAHVATAPPVELTASEMTERQRRIVERGIRRRLAAVAFGDEDMPGPERAFGERLERAVVDAVTSLERDRSGSGTGRLVALLDLLELDGRHVPFDAQTRFYDAFLAAESSGLSDPILSAIAHRLGFGVRVE
jgi:alpha-amylase/alpha-mannosidase (GH57 family)